jgi:signal transduction histidine kinase
MEPRSPRSSQPWHSLERKLPLLIGAVVALVLLSALVATHHEVRQGAVEATDLKLERMAEQVGAWAENALAQRQRAVLEVVADPAIAALLQGDSSAVLRAAAALDALRSRADSGLVIHVRDTSGRIALATLSADEVVSPPGASEAAAAAAATTRPLPDRPSLGRPFIGEGSGKYWVAAPVRGGDRLLGHVYQLRRASSPTLGAQLEALTGERLDIYFTADGSPWIGLDGGHRDGNAAPDTGRPFSYRAPDGMHYAIARDVGESGWQLILDLPMSSVLAPTRAVTRRLLPFGVVLLFLGGLLAWLVSRSVTAPLRRLGAAADDIAAGHYSRRTGVYRTDEIGHLARSLDAMAAHVEATHEEVEQRFRVARSLAAELKEANERLQTAIDEIDAARTDAQQASRAKSEFLATISHEIRTPINAVIGYTDLMQLGIAGPLSEQQLDYVLRIRRSGEHLTTLVNDVLDFAKIESGQMRVARDVSSVPACINAAVTMLQGQAADKHVNIVARCPLESVFLGDPHRAQQILLNLLANAIKFTPVHGEIHVRCERRASHAHPPLEDASDQHLWTCITVADNGIGIEADQLERIFEPFVQARPGYTRLHGGAGLGLAISRSLARMMGGDISVESQAGHGASFTVWLPHPASATATAAGG